MADESNSKQFSYEAVTPQHGADNEKTLSVNRTETSSSARGQGIESNDRLLQVSSNDSAAKSTYLRKTVPTTENPFEKANRYLYKHNLFPLFQVRCLFHPTSFSVFLFFSFPQYFCKCVQTFNWVLGGLFHKVKFNPSVTSWVSRPLGQVISVKPSR